MLKNETPTKTLQNIYDKHQEMWVRVEEIERYTDQYDDSQFRASAAIRPVHNIRLNINNI